MSRTDDEIREAARLRAFLEDAESLEPERILLRSGTCQVCGRVTTDRYCYASARCREFGGGEVM